MMCFPKKVFKFLIFLIFATISIVIFLVSKEIDMAKEVSCESVSDGSWENVGNVKTCYMDKTSSIKEPDVTVFKHDELMSAMWLAYNKKIVYLPVGVGETFPNLLIYHARGCSIKEIMRKNFKSLSKLKILFLSNNQIENISSETFNDLASLQSLRLSKKL